MKSPIVSPRTEYFAQYSLLSLSKSKEVHLGHVIIGTNRTRIESVVISPVVKSRGTVYIFISILVAGDISSNPGPVRKVSDPCTVCKRGVIKSSKAVSCDECEMWTHIRRTNDITNEIYNELSKTPNFSFLCNVCLNKVLPK